MLVKIESDIYNNEQCFDLLDRLAYPKPHWQIGVETSQMRTKQQVISITQILNLISEGALKVPHFQRPFVWKAHHIMALFDSIAKGYPIGSVI
jgi:hypothetical protein